MNSGHQLAMGRPLLFLNQGNGALVQRGTLRSAATFEQGLAQAQTPTTRGTQQKVCVRVLAFHSRHSVYGHSKTPGLPAIIQTLISS